MANHAAICAPLRRDWPTRGVTEVSFGAAGVLVVGVLVVGVLVVGAVDPPDGAGAWVCAIAPAGMASKRAAVMAS